MAVELGLAGLGDPREIYATWYPHQLVSMYSYIVNKKYKEIYKTMDKKEQAKHPEVIVERILDKNEVEMYKKQHKKKIAKAMSNITAAKK